MNEVTGTVIVLGATDTGKTTLTKRLRERLEERRRDLAVLDGDPGQSTLGVPGTMTLRDSKGQTKSWFVGSTSPRGHMLTVATGARRLIDTVSHEGTILYDTTGLIDPSAGGLYLKRSLIDLLRPEIVVALQRDDELEPLLEPLRRRRNVELFELSVSDTVTRKRREQRADYRRNKFREHFQNASDVRIDWTDKAVWPRPGFKRGQLVGLCGENGFVRELGIVAEPEPKEGVLTLRTPAESPDGIAEIRSGSLRIDLDTYRDELSR